MFAAAFQVRKSNVCCLCCRPDLIEYEGLRGNNAMANLNNAFDVAFNDLGISRLLDAEGLAALEYLFS